ncbi:hypothetical protein BD779DRAFT_274761 [Infundibulicybe gibba]|nr:hypothetical protein BD779DRAFT_274761 [Infundibulicybe gibba]
MMSSALERQPPAPSVLRSHLSPETVDNMQISIGKKAVRQKVVEVISTPPEGIRMLNHKYIGLKKGGAAPPAAVGPGYEVVVIKPPLLIINPLPLHTRCICLKILNGPRGASKCRCRKVRARASPMGQSLSKEQKSPPGGLTRPKRIMLLKL